jgi:hypothetical protein
VFFRRWDIISGPFVEGHARQAPPGSGRVDHHACFGAMITTARHMQDLRLDDIEIGDLGGAGLLRPCVIRLARLATFYWSDQVRGVGTLHRRERPAIARLLRRWLGI